MRAANRLHSRFGEAEMLDLALLYQLLDRAGDVFHPDVRIDAVLIEEIHALRIEPFERSLGNLFNALGAAIYAVRRVSNLVAITT